MKRTKVKEEFLEENYGITTVPDGKTEPSVPQDPPKEELPRWRKTGGGTFRMANGKIIKPGQVFRAAVEEIPKGFRGMIVPVDPLPEEAPIEAGPSVYEVVTSSPGWYNVIDGQGKIVNEKSLRQAAAKELIESLS